MTIKTNTIAEYTAAAGVTIDGLLVKDGGIPQAAVTAHQGAVDHGSVAGLSDDDHAQYLLATGARAGSSAAAQDFGATGIKANVIAESSAAAGVTIDGVLVKDGLVDGADISAIETLVENTSRRVFNVLDYGAVGDGATDNAAALAAAIAAIDNDLYTYGALSIYGSAPAVHFPPGVYRFDSEVLAAKKVMRFTGDQAILLGNHAGYILTINNTVLTPYASGANNTDFIEFDGLIFVNPSGYGVRLGVKTSPFIRFTNCRFYNIANYAIDAGEAVTFIKLDKCVFMSTGGVKTRAQDDVFIVDGCNFIFSTAPDLDVAAVTFSICRSDFEYNFGSKANIVIRAGGGSGEVHGCRFGSEGTNGGVAIAPYDIWVGDSADSTTGLISGLKITNCTHFTTTGTYRKVAPVRILRPIRYLHIDGYYVDGNYSSGVVAYLDASETAYVRSTYSSTSLNYIRDIKDLSTTLRGLFACTSLQDGNRTIKIMNTNVSVMAPFLVVSAKQYVSQFDVIGIEGAPANNTAKLARILGLTYYTTSADSYPDMILPSGSVVTTTLDASAAAIGDAVYVSDTATLSLTPGTNTKKVGFVLSATTNAVIMFQFSV